MVFTEFLDMVERRYGIEVLDAVLTASGVESLGAYTSVGTYDWREFVALAEATAEHVGVPLPQLLRGYGQYLFGVFVKSHASLFADVTSAFDFLENVEAFIHPEVRKLYPDADLPRFEIERSGDTMTMHYRSKRPFAQFARGLIEGCLLHFAVAAEVDMTGEGSDCRFSICQRKGDECPTAKTT